MQPYVHRQIQTQLRRLRRFTRFLGLEFLALRDALPGNFHCRICMRDRVLTANAVRFAMCRHQACKGCARAYILSKLEERQLPILCPVCIADSERPGDLVGGM
jgi:hypothetical protein